LRLKSTIVLVVVFVGVVFSYASTGFKGQTPAGIPPRPPAEPPDLSEYAYVRVGEFDGGGSDRLHEQLVSAFLQGMTDIECLHAETDTTATDSVVVLEGSVRRFWPGMEFSRMFQRLGGMFGPRDSTRPPLPDMSELMDRPRLIVDVRLRDATTDTVIWSHWVGATSAAPVEDLTVEVAERAVRLINAGCTLIEERP
jgi:hypothetical protein